MNPCLYDAYGSYSCALIERAQKATPFDEQPK